MLSTRFGWQPEERADVIGDREKKKIWRREEGQDRRSVNAAKA